MNKAGALLKYVVLSRLDEAIRLSKTSIDDQVDAILLRFESDCISDFVEEPPVAEGRLIEAPDDDEKDDPKPKPELGSPIDAEEKPDPKELEKSTTDIEDEQPDQESDPLQPKIDVHKFAGKVSRLASNYESLLDMPVAIVNRAKNYLEQNYNASVAKEFIDILKNNFDIDIKEEPNEQPREQPMATGAAASGLGG